MNIKSMIGQKIYHTTFKDGIVTDVLYIHNTLIILTVDFNGQSKQLLLSAAFSDNIARFSDEGMQNEVKACIAGKDGAEFCNPAPAPAPIPEPPKISKGMLDFFYPQQFVPDEVIPEFLSCSPTPAKDMTHGKDYCYTRYNAELSGFERCSFQHFCGSVPVYQDALPVLERIYSILNRYQEELRAEYTITADTALYSGEIAHNDIAGWGCAVKIRGPLQELKTAAEAIRSVAEGKILLLKVIATNRGDYPCEARFEFSEDVDIQAILNPVLPQIKNARVLYVNAPEKWGIRQILYKEGGKSIYRRKTYNLVDPWDSFYNELCSCGRMTGKIGWYFGTEEWEMNDRTVHVVSAISNGMNTFHTSYPIWPEDLAAISGQADIETWSSINDFSSEPAVETMDRETPEIVFANKRFVFNVYNRPTKQQQIAEIQSRGGMVKEYVTNRTDYLIVDPSYESTGFEKAQKLIKEGSPIRILSQRYLSKYMREHPEASGDHDAAGPASVRPAAAKPKKAPASVAPVLTVTTDDASVDSITITGKSFVHTLLSMKEEEELGEIVRGKGGMIKGAVSGKTDYLIVADNSVGDHYATVKYRKAVELREKGKTIIILSYGKFLSML